MNRNTSRLPGGGDQLHQGCAALQGQYRVERRHGLNQFDTSDERQYVGVSDRDVLIRFVGVCYYPIAYFKRVPHASLAIAQ